MDRFREALDGSEREFEYVHWLKINELQPIFVPAEVRLKVQLRSPYADEWAPTTLPRELQLKRRDRLEIGDVTFEPALSVKVLVVDGRGQPVEGIPVRRRHEHNGAWCVAHNTDAKGLAHFYVNARSKGHFRVRDFPEGADCGKEPNLTVPFEVGDKVESDSPYTITLTDQQIRVLLGRD
jgi:hypothetical protein